MLHHAVPALILLAGTALAQPGHDDHIGADACGKSLLARFAAGLNPDGSGGPDEQGGIFGPREGMGDTDVLHNNLDFEIIPGANTISGSNTMTIRSTVNGLTEFTFALRNNFTVSQVLFNNADVLAAPVFVGTYLQRVTLPRPVALNEVFTLRISYSGVAVSRGFGSIEFTTLGGASAVFSLSEPYYAATWWPCKDGDVQTAGDNLDKATLDIAVTAPTAMTVCSNGLLQGVDTLTGARRRHRWHSDYPIATYLVSFGAATFNTWTSSYTYPLQGGGSAVMPLNFFVSPGSDSGAQRQAWERSADMMAAYRGVYGEYPFVNEKYGIYQFTFGGGMEHQTMTGQAASTSESLTSHELAHQWWGDNVTCRTWSDIWLNEGFATYSECIWAERKPGSTGTPALLSAIGARRPGTLGSGSVYRYDVSSANTIFSGTFAYNKGAWVLHGLRKTLGDQTFFAALQSYRQQYQGSSATTDDFADAVSNVAGRDMRPFFDAWVKGEGSPAFVAGSQKVAVNGRDYLKLRVRQNQASPAATYFPCGLDVRTVAAGGTQNSFVLTGAATSWHIIPLTVTGAVSSVTLDPDDWILNQGKASEAYVQGPPKVLTLSPEPGASLASPPASIQVGFSDNISAVQGHFTLLRNGSPVACTYSYNASTFVATLTPNAPLAPGAYSLSVSDLITANTGQRLDGEIVGGALPSGDGAAGGSASVSFTVAAPPCPADFNGDGFLDFFDYDDYVNCFETGACPSGKTADFNADGFADFFDYDDFVAAFEAGC